MHIYIHIIDAYPPTATHRHTHIDRQTDRQWMSSMQFSFHSDHFCHAQYFLAQLLGRFVAFLKYRAHLFALQSHGFLSWRLHICLKVYTFMYLCIDVSVHTHTHTIYIIPTHTHTYSDSAQQTSFRMPVFMLYMRAFMQKCMHTCLQMP
jgi:hypothetical protein